MRVVVDQVILEVHVILKTPSISILGVPDGDFATPEGSPKANQSSQIVPPATSQTQVIISSIVFDSEKLLGHISPDNDEIDDHLNDSFVAVYGIPGKPGILDITL